MQRDSLDFKSMSVGKLFSKQLFPTIMGMVAAALFTVIDGIFVGNGIGSDAIAAVNISAPIFMIVTGVGLMFGMGGGILSSINLSKGKYKVANINLTQSVVALVVVSVVMTLLFTAFPHKVGRLFGSDEYLLDMVVEYLFWFSISLPFTVLVVALPFFIRLTNPKVSMWAMLAATLVNIVLDYLFIFVFKWGLFGAALATDIGELIGAAIMLAYLFRRSIVVRFVRLKMSIKSILLTLRNVGYMVRLGFSVFLSEITISIMIIAGNYAFMSHLGADGVAAYSVICYLFPIIFMVFNATVQSAQPIISYNYGCGQMERSNKALRLAMTFACFFAVVVTIFFMCFAQNIVSSLYAQYNKCFVAICGVWVTPVCYRLPIFRHKRNYDRLLYKHRAYKAGYDINSITRILPVVFFFALPLWLDITGIWLVVVAGDIVTALVILLLLLKDKVCKNGGINK